jgi:hypothetical protein
MITKTCGGFLSFLLFLQINQMVKFPDGHLLPAAATPVVSPVGADQPLFIAPPSDIASVSLQA